MKPAAGTANLLWFQGARPDHVRVEIQVVVSSLMLGSYRVLIVDPGELHVTDSPPIGKRI